MGTASGFTSELGSISRWEGARRITAELGIRESDGSSLAYNWLAYSAQVTMLLHKSSVTRSTIGGSLALVRTGNAVLDELSNADRRDLLALCNRRILTEGQNLIAGEPDVIFPISAVLAETATPGPASPLASMGALAGQRDVVGGLEAMVGKHGPCFSVLIPGEAFALPADVFREAAWKQPNLIKLMFLSAKSQITTAGAKARSAIIRKSEVRLAGLILELHELSSLTGLRLTQEKIGKLLGIRRSSINWAAQSLSDAGAIRYTRGRIRIEDLEELKRFARAVV